MADNSFLITVTLGQAFRPIGLEGTKTIRVTLDMTIGNLEKIVFEGRRPGGAHLSAIGVGNDPEEYHQGFVDPSAKLSDYPAYHRAGARLFGCQL